ncbi:hypothetical protein VTO58DRAFT_105374 [Aureobasidium pullulans]|nr:hypothetical protein JADG_007479 [Aureobasidium pullulans]
MNDPPALSEEQSPCDPAGEEPGPPEAEQYISNFLVDALQEYWKEHNLYNNALNETAANYNEGVWDDYLDHIEETKPDLQTINLDTITTSGIQDVLLAIQLENEAEASLFKLRCSMRKVLKHQDRMIILARRIVEDYGPELEENNSVSEVKDFIDTVKLVQEQSVLMIHQHRVLINGRVAEPLDEEED